MLAFYSKCSKRGKCPRLVWWVGLLRGGGVRPSDHCSSSRVGSPPLPLRFLGNLSCCVVPWMGRLGRRCVVRAREEPEGRGGRKVGLPRSLTRVYLIHLSQPFVQSDLLLQALVCRSPPQQARSVRQVGEGRRTDVLSATTQRLHILST